ncbi:MAG TPA: hypothetical protein VEH51_10785 [Burkholderiales bacterium]|nr:hypothetical protein [Burkholderiales bacterium]
MGRRNMGNLDLGALLLVALLQSAPHTQPVECQRALHEAHTARLRLLVAEHRYMTGLPDYQPVLDAERALRSIEVRARRAGCGAPRSPQGS